MLKKKNRLSSIGIKTKSRISTPLFGLSFSNNGQDLSRFSFIISKKIDKRAVVRNKAKRKIRSVIEEMLDRIDTGKDFVFYLKKDVVDTKKDDVRAEINKIFKENKFLK